MSALGGELARGVAAVAARLGWHVDDLATEVQSESHLRLSGERSADTRQVVLVVHDRSSVVVCYAIATITAPPPVRGAVAELLTRINYGLVEGNFELDLADGEVRFKTSAFVVDEAPLEPVMERLLTFNLAVFDLYHAAIEPVATGRAGPTTALATVEGP